MLLKENLQYNYDSKYDVLYLGIGDKRNSYGDDSESGLIYLRDMDSEELTGITIFGFLRKYVSNSLPTFPKDIDAVLKEIGAELSCKNVLTLPLSAVK